MPFFSLSPTGTVDATSLRGRTVSATAAAEQLAGLEEITESDYVPAT